MLSDLLYEIYSRGVDAVRSWSMLDVDARRPSAPSMPLSYYWDLNMVCIRFKLEVQNVWQTHGEPIYAIQSLALKDVYVIGKDDNRFAVMPGVNWCEDLDFDSYLPSLPVNSFVWCHEIELNLPDDKEEALKMGAKCVRKAGWGSNEVDSSVASSIKRLLPNFFTQSAIVAYKPFYNSYLQVPIDRVFTSARGYRVHWTRDDRQDILAFVATGQGVCSNTTFAIGEFAPPFATFEEQQDTLVTLGTKMKAALNKLKSLGVENLKVCGIWVNGAKITTFVMDLPVTELHRMTPVCTCSVISTFEHLSHLPSTIRRLIQLANIGKATLAAAEKVLKDN